MSPFPCQEYGFQIVPRETVFSNLLLHPYRGAPQWDAETLAVLHAHQSVQLMERVQDHRGAFVLFSPDDDAEGYVLVGDDPHALSAECVAHMEDMVQ